MKKIGVIVNPVAGIGGRVGLKGSDGAEILQRALEMGAQPEAPNRAVEALKGIAAIKDSIEVITYPSEMGENECREVGIIPHVIGTIDSGKTTAEDTIKAVRDMVSRDVSLILFGGGDGTARNVYTAMGEKIPALGIPAGVKIHSAVYAVTPRLAGEVAKLFLTGKLMNIREAEVMDIDEDAFRRGVVSAKLYGYLRVPEERKYVQSVKSGGITAEKEQLQGISSYIIEEMENDKSHFIIGPGTTTRMIMQDLGLKNTLLGVDVVHKKNLVANDVSEKELLDIINGEDSKIVVTVIGGQGHVFGR
jgi:predicted polyphosphate/ATP-dependent NAD kinase